MSENPVLPQQRKLQQTLRRVVQRVAPVWPLDSFVAVNPYLGLTDQDFASAAATLNKVAGARMTLPGQSYAQALEQGRIQQQDIEEALSESGIDATADEIVRRAQTSDGASNALVQTVADALSDGTGDDWKRCVDEHVCSWAACYFDAGQAIWRAPRDSSLFSTWRAEALVDRNPEVMGLRGFRRALSTFPDAALPAAAEALRRLEVPEAGLELYLHRLLVRVGGWAAFAARIVWERRLYDEVEDDTALELLAVFLCWEAILLETCPQPAVQELWRVARGRLVPLAQSTTAGPGLEARLVLQLAYERATQRQLLQTINEQPAGEAAVPPRSRPRFQTVFCIDVRSEVFRRHLEATDSRLETLGFAGFFGFPVELTPLAHGAGGAQCPVLLKPTHRICETTRAPSDEQRAERARVLRHEVSRAWQSFKMGAVSCFSFVGPIGLAYLPKLIADAFGLSRPVPHPAQEGLGSIAEQRDVALEPSVRSGQRFGIPLAERIELATGALGAMSLTNNFARLVLICGHGSTTVNNPHATGLDCGACGGRTGEANARVAAAVLNDPQVRAGLTQRGIEIPADTVFVAGQHDTTTDVVTVFNRDAVPESHRAELTELEHCMDVAGHTCRAERAARLPLSDAGAVDRAVRQRSRDWAQVRPEWGLAGCSAFVIAPRERTANLNLGGRCFLHTYAWKQDASFSVLELIMTAPMVVASWISLQYYGSTVDNELFGSGNKTLHNVVGHVGVLEGNGGDLRVGLPWQSVHDGERLQHEPVRLNVIIEAPIDAMNAIIEKNPSVRQLLDNHWIELFAMDRDGKVTQRYVGELRWSEALETAHLSDLAA